MARQRTGRVGEDLRLRSARAPRLTDRRPQRRGPGPGELDVGRARRRHPRLRRGQDDAHRRAQRVPSARSSRSARASSSRSAAWRAPGSAENRAAASRGDPLRRDRGHPGSRATPRSPSSTSRTRSEALGPELELQVGGRGERAPMEVADPDPGDRLAMVRGRVADVAGEVPAGVASPRPGACSGRG